MKENKQNGSVVAPSVTNPQTKDTASGAAASTVLTTTEKNFGSKVSKIANLQKKVLQLHNLTDHRDSLLKFSVEKDDHSQVFRIADGERHSFETHNANICKTVSEFLIAQFNEKIPQLENEILNATL